MSRINTNIGAIRAMTRLNSNTEDLQVRLNRLSTGLRINAGKDDPAGLIASENLRSEMAGIRQGISNSTRASSVIATAEGALNEVSALLLDLKGLINGSANEGGLALEEIQANQLQIDSAVASINRIANSTSFEGNKLLNGSYDFTLSGVDTTEVKDLRMQEVRFGTASTMPVEIEVDTAAAKAELRYSASGVGNGTVTLEIAGNKGVEVFTFAASTKTSAIKFAVNQAMDVTGVEAVLTANDHLIFRSETYGTKAFVSVEAISGTFALTGGATRDEGADAVVLVNGIRAVSEGLDVQINGPNLSFEATLDASLNTAGSTTSFDVTGGGTQFQLGPQVNAQQMSVIGIQSVAAHVLGSADTGYLRDITTGGSKSILAGNYQEADKIVEASISQAAKLRGRLGAFQKNVLATNINSLNVALENITASESAIRDANFAEETAAMTRSQILVQAGTSVLAIANSAPQNVLALLG